jgi:hypothetical protein
MLTLFKFRIKIWKIKRKPNSPPSWAIDPYTYGGVSNTTIALLGQCVHPRCATTHTTAMASTTSSDIFGMGARSLPWAWASGEEMRERGGGGRVAAMREENLERCEEG